MFLWRVGTDDAPATEYPDGTGQDEITVVKEQIESMAAESSMVVSHRHDVKVVGAENKAIKAEGYLQYFRERLIAGLDVSSVDMGIGNTSTKSTASMLSRNLIDIVKFHQLETQETVTLGVVDELLEESTFPQETVLDAENAVRMKFKEIDKETQILTENHKVDIFTKNAISHPELRDGLGKEPMTPEEEEELYLNKIKKPELEFEAEVKAASSMFGSGAVASKNNPSNQHGERGAPNLEKDFNDAAPQKVNPILRWHNLIRDELQLRWLQGTYKLETARADIISTYEAAIADFLIVIKRTIRANYLGSISDPDYRTLVMLAERRARRYITRLRDDVIYQLGKNRGLPPDATFNALRYRARLIYRTETAYMRNLSKYQWARVNKTDVEVVSLSGEPCEICRDKLKTVSWNDKLGEAKIGPFHPNCRCSLRMIERK
jgi:hypothetical protein